MAHTPGPWHRDGVEIYDADGKHVVWELGVNEDDNAPLICAAPDLLAALKVLVEETILRDNPRDEGVFSDGDEVKAAQAAIAKAENGR